LEFRILGPLEVRREGRPVRLGGSRERTVLAVLLLNAGRVVPMHVLVDAVWDQDPPPKAEKAVRNNVSALRASLALEAGADSVIETTPPGYRLGLSDGSLDALDFRQQIAAAGNLAAAGQVADAAAKLRAALRLWRGPALGGIAGPVVEAAAARLEEQRLAALEECLDLELGLGRHRQLVSELRELVRQWPLRERLAGQLMLAFYRSGRQAEALDAFRHLAARLADDLGIDPCGEVARLHEAILRQDPALDLGSAQAAGAGTAAAQSQEGSGDARTDAAPASAAVEEPALGLLPLVPAQLPRNVPDFTGRAAELERLHGLLPPEGGQPAGDTAVISAIGGTAGVGKTALALHFAHQVAQRFPDGQLYVNLRGFDPSGPPVDPGEALRGFLGALGVAPGQIPAGVHEQAALFRSLLAGRRMLVFLDNARDAGQLRPLLPATSGCLVVVTSRNQLTGLVAAEGARPLSVDVLSEDEAAGLLAARIGAGRLDAEPAAAAELAGLCARLPLALSIVAARAAARPGLPLGTLAAELRDARDPLEALTTGDAATDLRAVFSWSYHQLPAPAARLFRLLGLHPGPDIPVPAAASLAAVPLPEARGLLGELVRAHLLIEHVPGRFAFHDLLRAYAASLAAEGDDPGTAFGRLFDYYLSTAAAAMGLLHPAEVRRRPRVEPPATPTPGLADPRAALAWLDAERPVLVSLAVHGSAHGWPTHVVQLATVLDRYLQGGHDSDGLVIHGHARDAARRADDKNGEAHALRQLSGACWRLGRYQKAAEHLEQALALYRSTRDRPGEARALGSLGTVEWLLGRPAAAIRRTEQALTLYRQASDRVGEASALTHLGDGLQRLGRYQDGTRHLMLALALSRQDRNRHSEAAALNNLGEAEQGAGHLDLATEDYLQALTIFREIGHRTGEARALANLGTVYTALGQPERATAELQQALDLFHTAGSQADESHALNGLGEAARAAGRPAEAVTHHAAALRLALATGNREHQARAHAGLARSYGRLGEPARAREHYQHALSVYTSLGYPEAEQIRARLADLGPATRPRPRPLDAPR
jgi:DNA-binding SARP family transcriptional activator